MKVGILGGSFDPPHFGHLLMARQTREMIGLDQVWLMPYFVHAWDVTTSDAAQRLAMAKLIEEEGILASDEEIVRQQKSYTINTVRRLKSAHNYTFFWIIGSDVVGEFPRWKEAEVLAKEIEFLVFPRNGYPISHELPPGFQPVTSPDLVTSNLSSTMVRSRLRRGLSVVGLIPDAVLAYIKEHGLYAYH